MLLQFDSAPKAPWIKFFRLRKGLSSIDDFPKIEGTVDSVSTDALHACQEICGLPTSNRLPICYPQILATTLHMHLLTAKDFPFSALGLVHVRQQIDQHAVIEAGMPLRLQAWVDTLVQGKSGVEFDIHTALYTGDTLLWRAISTTLSRGMKGDGKKRPRIIPEKVEGTERTLAVPENLGRRYMKISGDINPIHIHAWLAKPFGFRRAIIHGMWTLARVISHLEPQSLDARFVRPVFLPSRSRIFENEAELLVQSEDAGKTQLYIQINP